MAKRLLLACALIIASVLAQTPGVLQVERAVASGTPQALLNTSGSAPSAAFGTPATPYPVLTPQRKMGIAAATQPVDPRMIAQRIAGFSYSRISSKQHLAPQALSLNGSRAVPTASQPGASRLGTGGRIQALGARTTSGVSIRPLTVTTGTADNDGIKPWWGYTADALGGIGRYMINLANANVVVQSEDMRIANKGIDFVFGRTYNALSAHDYQNDDGSSPSLYGDKWTNTFDVHIAYNDFTPVNGQKGVSLYNTDGARYDYAPVGDGHSFLAPAGQFSALYYDGTGYSLTKKSGVVFYFWDLNQVASQAALAGQIETIFGRNHNNYLGFVRTYSPDASKPANIVKLVVTAEDGRQTTLNYGVVTGNGGPYTLLQTLVWPDGTTTVTYGYTIQAWGGANGWDPVLSQVTSPGNGSTTSGSLVEQYTYDLYVLMRGVWSPRWVCSHNGDCTTSGGNPILWQSRQRYRG
jgi:hypothetical protein